MNRIAWLGQAAVCYQSNVPSRYSSCWMDLDKSTREKADNTVFVRDYIAGMTDRYFMETFKETTMPKRVSDFKSHITH